MKTMLTISILTMLMFSCDESSNHETTETVIENETSEKLTRENALIILQESYTGEICTGSFMSKTNSSWGRDEEYNADKNKCIALEDSGYVSIHEDYDNRNGYFKMHLTIEDKGAKEYDASVGSFRGNAILTVEYATEILGMSFSDDDQQADVVFLVETKPTPFYSIALNRGGSDKCSLLGTAEREVTFVKYDTGWRIKQNQNN
jgi:hypothetical protein